MQEKEKIKKRASSNVQLNYWKREFNKLIKLAVIPKLLKVFFKKCYLGREVAIREAGDVWLRIATSFSDLIPPKSFTIQAL